MDDEKTATITFIQKTIASVKMLRLVWKNRFLRTRKIQIELDSIFFEKFHAMDYKKQCSIGYDIDCIW